MSKVRRAPGRQVETIGTLVLVAIAFTLVRYSIERTILTRAACNIALIGNCVPIAIAAVSRGNIAKVRKPGGIAIQIPARLTFIGDPIVVAVLTQTEKYVARIGRLIVIAIRLAFIRNTVGVAVVARVDRKVTSIRSSVVVAIGLAAVRNPIVIAIRAGSSGDIQFVQNAVAIAIRHRGACVDDPLRDGQAMERCGGPLSR